MGVGVKEVHFFILRAWGSCRAAVADTLNNRLKPRHQKLWEIRDAVASSRRRAAAYQAAGFSRLPSPPGVPHSPTVTNSLIKNGAGWGVWGGVWGVPGHTNTHTHKP